MKVLKIIFNSHINLLLIMNLGIMLIYNIQTVYKIILKIPAMI